MRINEGNRVGLDTHTHTHTAKKCRCQTSSAMDTARPWKKKATNEHLEKRAGVRSGHSRIRVQLETKIY